MHLISMYLTNMHLQACISQACISQGYTLQTYITISCPEVPRPEVAPGRNRVPKSSPRDNPGPESVTTVHSQPHRQMGRLEPSPSHLRIFPLPSSLPSSHPS